MIMDEDERHLGDGLFASYDGFQIALRAPRADGDHVVYLEPSVYQALVEFVEQIKHERSPAAARQPEGGGA